MSKYKFSLIWVLFIIPMIVSGLIYHFRSHFHFHTLNYGQLINPPIKVECLADTMRSKQWKIIYIADSICDAHCVKIKFQLYQLKKALGKDEERVSVVTFLSSDPKVHLLENDFQKFSNKQIVYSIQNKIYLVDPLNYLFMSYPADMNGMSILKDLKKVLGASQIG